MGKLRKRAAITFLILNIDETDQNFPIFSLILKRQQNCGLYSHEFLLAICVLLTNYNLSVSHVVALFNFEVILLQRTWDTEHEI